MARKRRSLLVGSAAAAVLLGVAACVLLRAPAAPEAQAPTATAGTQPTRPPPGAEPQPAARTPDASGLEQAVARLPQLSGIAERTAQSYRDRARFPAWSHPLADGIDPLLRDREITPGRSHPADSLPGLRVAPTRVSFESPAPVGVVAWLEADGERVAAEALSGEVRDARGNRVARLSFRDDGRGGDRSAEDLQYTASLEDAEALGLRGAYLIEAFAKVAEGERSATTGFLYSVPNGTLTGRYRESLDDGGLRIEAEVRVWEPARFHLEATLGTRGGRPLVWSQAASQLEPGEGWIPLRFHGLALHEAGRDGPYRLLSVALTTTGEMPNHKNALVRDAYETRPYRLDDFSDTPFGDPSLLRAAEALEGH